MIVPHSHHILFKTGNGASEEVVNGLREIDKIGGDYDDIVNFLEDMGQIASARK